MECKPTERALAALNRSFSAFLRSYPARRRRRIVYRKVDLTCPVCRRADCTREWTDEAHGQ